MTYRKEKSIQKGVLFWTNLAVTQNYTYPEHIPTVMQLKNPGF
jgi:hypothetical protein